jgi:putative ABC transport system permease protein
MRWSLLELWRRRGRFAGMIATLTALCVLAIILLALSAGLWGGATGAVQQSSADLMVFSPGSLGTFARSRMPLADLPRLARIRGVAAAGALGTLALTVTTPRGTVDVAAMGVLPERPGAPARVLAGRLPAAGAPREALADIALRVDGVRLGSELRTEARTAPLRVVGFVADTRYQFLPTVWTSIATWQVLQARLQPETRGLPAGAQALTVRLARGAPPGRVARAIGALLPASAFPRAEAALRIPGASQMRSTIDELIGASLAVATVVTTLFFALITAERRGELARLRAFGASTWRIAGGLVVQGEAAVAVGVAAGYTGAIALLAAAPPSFPAVVTARSAMGLAIAFLITGAIGTGATLISVVRLDPATAMAAA